MLLDCMAEARTRGVCLFTTDTGSEGGGQRRRGLPLGARHGRGDDTVGNAHRAQSCQLELFQLILLLKLDKRLPVEQFEATVSQSTAPSPPLNQAWEAAATGALAAAEGRRLILSLSLSLSLSLYIGASVAQW